MRTPPTTYFLLSAAGIEKGAAHQGNETLRHRCALLKITAQ